LRLVSMSETLGKGLGRIHAFDPRDRRFLLKPPSAAAIDRTSRHWITAKALDQGDYPHCVAYAGTQFLLSAPVKNLPYSSPAELYNECQQNDEWEGADYDGTSVRALFKVLQSHGYISKYEWAFDLDSVVRQVLAKSPCVFGTTWYSGMMETDKFGFAHAKGSVVGGHAYIASGVNLKKKWPDGSLGALRCMNSWSADWGEKGKFWLSFSDARKLIADFGEACVADELKFRAEQ
jgi:hypothetical protein